MHRQVHLAKSSPSQHLAYPIELQGRFLRLPTLLEDLNYDSLDALDLFAPRRKSLELLIHVLFHLFRPF